MHFFFSGSYICKPRGIPKILCPLAGLAVHLKEVMILLQDLNNKNQETKTLTVLFSQLVKVRLTDFGNHRKGVSTEREYFFL